MGGERIDPVLKRKYDGYYDGASEWRRIGALDKAANIVRLCAPYPHDSILEIGAGEGAILERLSALGFGRALHALEISTSALDSLRRREIRSLVDCRGFDGSDVPYEDDRFDLAILSHVLEHVEYPRKLLYEARRVARHVFVEVPLEDRVRLPRDFVPDDLGHINVYSTKTARWLVQTCGLEVLQQIVTNPSRRAHAHREGWRGTLKHALKESALRLLTTPLATRLFVYHSALVCRRTVTTRNESVTPKTRENPHPG